MQKNFQSKSTAIISDFGKETPSRKLLMSSNSMDQSHIDEIKENFQVVAVIILIITLGSLLFGVGVYSFFF